MRKHKVTIICVSCEGKKRHWNKELRDWYTCQTCKGSGEETVERYFPPKNRK